jgi:putative hydrolases of HD superfamily
MTPDPELHGLLAFLRSAERLKNVPRTAWTSEGHRESVAEHSWRLCLMALVLAPEFPDIDMARLLKMCVIHDLGEALGGDISATLQPPEGKAAQERADLLELMEPLPPVVRSEILELWDEYEAASSPEARIAKALDKLETILQHNQGRNPPTFDYDFNLDYGARYTSVHPVLGEIRRILDQETAARAEANRRPGIPAGSEPRDPSPGESET